MANLSSSDKMANAAAGWRRGAIKSATWESVEDYPIESCKAACGNAIGESLATRWGTKPSQLGGSISGGMTAAAQCSPKSCLIDRQPQQQWHFLYWY
jgi:hypothetical protein